MRHAASALASACGIGMQHRHAASIFDFMISKSEKSHQLALDLQSYKIKIQTLVIIESLNKILLKVSKVTLICYFADFYMFYQQVSFYLNNDLIQIGLKY